MLKALDIDDMFNTQLWIEPPPPPTHPHNRGHIVSEIGSWHVKKEI